MALDLNDVAIDAAEKRRQYRRANRERRREYNRRWRAENPERVRVGAKRQRKRMTEQQRAAKNLRQQKAALEARAAFAVAVNLGVVAPKKIYSTRPTAPPKTGAELIALRDYLAKKELPLLVRWVKFHPYCAEGKAELKWRVKGYPPGYRPTAEHLAKLERRKRWRDNRTPEQKSQDAAIQADWRANRTPEQKQKDRSNVQIASVRHLVGRDVVPLQVQRKRQLVQQRKERASRAWAREVGILTAGELHD